MTPGVPGLRKAVDHDHQRALTLEAFRQKDAEVRALEPVRLGVLVLGAVVPGLGGRHVRELGDVPLLSEHLLIP
jgi:hypothetical protein